MMRDSLGFGRQLISTSSDLRCHKIKVSIWPHDLPISFIYYNFIFSDAETYFVSLETLRASLPRGEMQFILTFFSSKSSMLIFHS